jgi:hypothetical protein
MERGNSQGFSYPERYIMNLYEIPSSPGAENKRLACRRGKMPILPGCHFARDVKVSCARCETPYHTGCWAQHGRCAVFGCPDYRAALFTPPARHVHQQTWSEFLWGMLMWASQTLGLAFLVFLPVTMLCFLFLPVNLFREFILSREYLLSFPLLSVTILIPIHRAMLCSKEELAEFVATATLLLAGVWVGAELWIHAHLPY